MLACISSACFVCVCFALLAIKKKGQWENRMLNLLIYFLFFFIDLMALPKDQEPF